MKQESKAVRTKTVLVIAGLFLILDSFAPFVMAGPRGFRSGTYNQPPPSRSRRSEFGETERLRTVMIPLIRAMDRPCPIDQVQISLVNQPEINAGNAGGCQFLVTAGLLRQASDDQLRGILAHEIAHQDLGHVARAQVLNTGLGIGVALLEQFFPGSSAFTPIAGTLIARGYGRTEEYAADRHGVEILTRAGYPAGIMVDTLNWLRAVSGDGGGGFLSTHPAIDERIAALRKLP
ncbi:MAG TPA: M48 family metallopeptidase [Candidatus Binatia bacterium]|nr:M48 family metallopeptidase [Candidatus Binatia bacterium]